MTIASRFKIVTSAMTVLLALLLTGSSAVAAPVPVEIRTDSGMYYLVRGGQPYWVKGAGGNQHLEQLVEIGGNSIRTWGEDPGEILDRAHALGLTVCVGIWIEHERHGFDYDDSAAVERQFERHRAMIDAHKNHPALLLWGIGNEVELEATNPKVWDLVERVAAYIREVDPNHPTMTVTAHLIPEVVKLIRARAPSVQILGVNTYAGIGVIADLAETYWQGPYMITEWGPNGQWEATRTEWGAEIEDHSSRKAFQRALRHGLIAGDRMRCLGGYAFQWGQKQEVTPTWYGFFTADGIATESVEMLAYAWLGRWPQARAPRIHSVLLNGLQAEASVSVEPQSSNRIHVALDPDSPAVIESRWYVLAESTDKRIGGDAEAKPAAVPVEIHSHAMTEARFSAPEEPGYYRLFVYLYGSDRKTVATGNFPFRVRE